MDPAVNSVNNAVDSAKAIGRQGNAPLGRSQDPSMMRETAVSTESAMKVFSQLLVGHGLRYALYSLLRLTDYRFISIFRFDDGTTASLAHVDRENLAVTETETAPESATYCCYVRTADGPFVTVDSTVDPRVEGHVKRMDLRAYCGIPIVSPEGELLGTLCHYDPLPRDPEQLDAELLVQVSSAIARSGLLAR